MILESLVLELFKRHVQLEVTFSETLTVIRGANYKGKSSLLEGLFFCLFGTSAIIGNKDQITTKGHKGKASAQLVFTHGGSRYYINRTLSTAALNRQLEDESWTTVATGHTAVNDAMVEMIGQDRERTLLLSYSRQGETAALATLGEAKLNAIVERVSGAVYADRLIERALLRVRDADAALEAVGPDPEFPLELMELRLSDLETVKATAEQLQEQTYMAKKAADVEHQQALTERKRIAEHNRLAEENKTKRSQLELSIATSQGSLTALEQQEAKAERPQDMAAATQRLTVLRESEQQIEQINTERRTLTTKRQGASDWITEYEPKYLLAEETTLPELNRIEQDLAAAINEQEDSNTVLSDLTSKIKQLKDSLTSSECPTCHRPYAEGDEGHDHKSRLEGQLEEAVAEQVKAKQINDTNKVVVQNLRNEQTAKQRALPPNGWRNDVRDKQQIIEKCNNRLAEIPERSSEELQGVLSEIAELGASIKRNNTVKTAWSELQQNLEAARTKLANQTANLERIEVLDAIDISAATQLVDTLAEKLVNMTKAEEETNAMMWKAANEFAEQGKLVEKERSRRERRRAAEHKKARFGGLAKWLRDNKTAFLAETWDQLMSLVSEFAAQVTEGAIERVLRTDDGTFVYEEAGFQQPLTLASGCQKSVIGAGIRIALDAVLSAGLGFLVLDEPSSDMDEQHAAALAGALRAQSRQVILVTHREGEEFTSDQLHILE